MALNNKKQKGLFTTVSGRGDTITNEQLTELKNRFDSNDYIVDAGSFDTLSPVLYQLQMVTEELDELRRYLIDDVGDGEKGDRGVDGTTPSITDLDGAALPTSRPASGLLWNDRGIVKIG